MTTPHPTSGGRDVERDEPEPLDALSDVARRLREARRAKGLTQEQVAKALDVSRRAVSEWETGVRLPHVAIPGLAALYEVSTTFLLYGVDPTDATLAAMRADVIVIVDEVQSLCSEIKSLRADLVALAEQSAAAFADLRALIEP